MTNIFIYLKKSSPVTIREVQLKTTKGTTSSETKDGHQPGFGEVGTSHTTGRDVDWGSHHRKHNAYK